MDVPRCCTNLKCTSAAKTARELLTKMEQIQTQLHNEVILWKLRFIRGICTEDSRQNFYELLRQFTTFHAMLDTVIECETKYFDAMQANHREDEVGAKVEAKESRNVHRENKAKQNGETADMEVKTPRFTACEEKALMKRNKFFAQVHERNVKLLFVVLNEVDECRSLVETRCTGHEMSEDVMVAMEGTGSKSLSVLDESIEEQQPEVRQQETVVLLSA